MSTQPVHVPPVSTQATRAAVDSHAVAFQKLEADLAAATAESKRCSELLGAKERELIELVRACGGPHREKSKILHGIVYEMVTTFAQYTTQDGAAVERFRQALIEAKQTRLMKKFFTADVRWTMNASAAEIAKTGKLSPKLMLLLLQCSTTKDKKPSLDVRAKKKIA